MTTIPGNFYNLTYNFLKTSIYYWTKGHKCHWGCHICHTYGNSYIMFVTGISLGGRQNGGERMGDNLPNIN